VGTGCRQGSFKVRDCRPVPELPMFSVFVPSESTLKKLPAADPAALPDNSVWIDLLKPTMEEDRGVERLAGIAVPTREDMQEIEISSRLYIENGARYMTATLMCHSDTDMPRTTAVTFILAGHRLVTVRYDEPKPFALVEHKLARSCMAGISGEMVLMELLDAVIDRCADILERAGAEVDQVSHDIFEPESARHGQAKRYSQILIAIGRKGDLVSKIRESLASIYGMNFKAMPELEWAHGYPMALVMMLMAAVLPYFLFKWKKWL